MYFLTYIKQNKVRSFNNFEDFQNQYLQLLQQPVERELQYITQTLKRPQDAKFNTDNLIPTLQALGNQIQAFLEGSPEIHEMYDVFQIPKRSGGMRTIKAPHDDLKSLQTNAKIVIEKALQVHPHNAAWAYREKRSIKGAIQLHQKNESEFFLKLDIKNFFDNCHPEFVKATLSKIFPFCHAPNLLDPIITLATLDNGLPQGTPLSPTLTNLIMVPFDHYLSMYAKRHGMVYTRYADDLLISSKNSFEFQKVVTYIEKLFVRFQYPFELKQDKTRYGTRHGRNWNLGLMLNKDNQITLGHETKRKLKVVLHKIVQKELPAKDPATIGMFAYLRQIEPDYYNGLNNYAYMKYGRGISGIINPR